MAVLIFMAVLFFMGCTGCHSRDDNGEDLSQGQAVLTVFAAASLAEAFMEAAQRFEEMHAVQRVVLNVAGSHQLAQQISLGAPADVFASANPAQMQVAVDAGRIDPGALIPFAGNRLIIVVSSSHPGRVDTWRDLSRPGIQLILADEAVPAGRYAREFLERASLEDQPGTSFQAQVINNVVSFEQNVRAVLTKVTLGEADAGIVYSSDALRADTSSVYTLSIPDTLSPQARYVIAPVTDSRSSGLANAFVAFVLSEEGQSLLRKYGFVGMPSR